ncbi:hypothetical protein MAUB1S_09679 [Mycolicibacterium aubagnense]
MTIPNAETRALLEEIRANLFKEAFIEFAVQVRLRDRKSFEAAAAGVRRALEKLPVKHLSPPADVKAAAIDLKLVQEQGLSGALADFNDAVNKIGHRLR